MTDQTKDTKRMVLLYHDVIAAGIEVIRITDDEYRFFNCADFSDNNDGGKWESHTVDGVPNERLRTVAFCLKCWQQMKDYGIKLEDGKPLDYIETWGS